MRKRKLGFVLPLALAAALILALGVSTGSARTQKKAAAFKAAWIYVGPHNDNGWSQAHDRGRLYVQTKLGSSVQTHPDVKFEMATGTAQSKNVAEYFGAGEDAIYLSGMAAGAATKKGVIGYVVPFATPEVLRHASAFTLGAQATHPGAKVKLIWTNSWLDLSKEKKAAQSLVSAGADVLGQNVDSPATGQYAESKGVPWVGYDSDAQKFAPKQWLTPAEDEGRDGRDLEDQLLLRQSQGGLRESGALRHQGQRQDEGSDRQEAGRPDQGHVLRVRRSAVRPAGQAARQKGPAAIPQGPLRGELAR